MSQGLFTKLHKDRDFVVMIDPIQVAPDHNLFLPNLILHRSFLAMDVQVPAVQGAREWLGGSPAFEPAQARATHLQSASAWPRPNSSEPGGLHSGWPGVLQVRAPELERGRGAPVPACLR